MYNIQLKLGVKNISDLTIKEFKGIYDKNYKTRKKYKHGLIRIYLYS